MSKIEAAKQEIRERLLWWHFRTGFGHRPGLRIHMSDRVYEVQKNGEYRRVA